jgi:hypothetical protein
MALLFVVPAESVARQRVAAQRDVIVSLTSQNAGPAKPLCHRVLNVTPLDEGS